MERRYLLSPSSPQGYLGRDTHKAIWPGEPDDLRDDPDAAVTSREIMIVKPGHLPEHPGLPVGWCYLDLISRAD
jgi:hypothetical protein